MVGTTDLDRARKYYDVVFSTIGLRRVEQADDYIAYASLATPDQIEFYVTLPFNGEPATVGNGSMVALQVDSRATVDHYHQVALQNGGADEGKPGLRPADGNVYYAYARDLDGNKICVFSDASN